MATITLAVDINGCEVMAEVEHHYKEVTAITGPSGEDLMNHFSRNDLGDLEEIILKDNDDFNFREPEYTSQDWSDFADICEP